MLHATRAIWPAIGPDYVVRLDAAPAPTVVPFPAKEETPAPEMDDPSEWGLARAILYQQDAGRFAAWLRALNRQGRVGARVTLKAPSRFHAAYVQTHLEGAILSACRTVDGDVTAIEIVD